MTQEQKEKIASILRERVVCDAYEFRLTDDYIYIGTTSGELGVISQETIDLIREVWDYRCNWVGRGFIVLSNTTGYNVSEFVTNSQAIQSVLSQNPIGVVKDGEKFTLTYSK